MSDIKVTGELIREYVSVKKMLVYRHLYIYKQKKHYRGILYDSSCFRWKNKSNILSDVSVDIMFPNSPINEDEINFIFELMKINKDEYSLENNQ